VKVLDSKATAESLAWNPLIDALRTGFISGCNAPLRHHHQVLLAVIDGGELTNRRTAAASALASKYLSRSDSKNLLLVGAGGLAPYLIAAHKAVRPIDTIDIWARDEKKAALVAEKVNGNVVTDLSQASAQADIISCATLAEKALVHGRNVNEGTHVDLVGAFTPHMRESDDLLIQKASLFVDTRDGVFSEGGDFIQPLNDGVIEEKDIKAELRDLCANTHPGRTTQEEITVFKSVGTALEDLVAGTLAYETSSSIRQINLSRFSGLIWYDENASSSNGKPRR